MNSEELKKEFGLLMPSEINGFKRPDESISSSNDFFLEIPQLISKDPVLYSTMNLIFSVILSNDKLLKQWLDTLQNVVNAQDWRVVTDSLKGYMTPELKKKLDGIATGANNYVHPANHPATMITQDATHRFVTDTEKTTWNGKASTAVVSTTANGLAPKRDGNASHFLAGDGTWKVVPSASSATSATKATQDSRGQQIDTTYVKGVTGSNATLTITKGNGTTSTTTINNVANATNANNSSVANKLGTSTVGSASKPIYLNAGTATACNIDLSTLAPKASPGLTGTPTAPTAAVDTNNTQIATCGFVRNAIAKYAPMLDTLKKVYPVGSIYMSTVSTNPATLFGFGTWEAMPAGRVLLAQGKSSWGTTYNAGSTGGEATHTLTVGELPAHNHAATISTNGEHNHTALGCNSSAGPNNGHFGEIGNKTDGSYANTEYAGNHSHTISINNIGGNNSHNNMPPYIAYYIWKRIA
nr:MAG TPA: Baseplate structural protein [Caudoviricetes sp.]